MWYRIGAVMVILLASRITGAQTCSVVPPIYPGDIDQPLDIHGYVESQFKSQHITPRGLVIADHGVEIQPVGGLTFDLYHGESFIKDASATVGVWNSINSSLHDPRAGSWFEIDYFARLNLKLANRIDVMTQYIAFDSPGAAFKTDNNLEIMVSYDDFGLLSRNFAVHPYSRLFYNVSGSSTTLLGRNGNTFDDEFGFIPTYFVKSIPKYPITLTLPTYITVGPKNFWGGSEYVGLFSTSLAAQIPLHIVPSRLGRWHLDGSVSYFDLLNSKLVDAAQELGNGRDRSRLVLEMGIGFEF
jgi:hypothetical protein